MNARTLAALAVSAVVGAFAFVPAFAQDAMTAGSGSSMSHDAMQGKDAMKASMHKDGMMKKDAMKHDAMKSKVMKHDGMMKKDDAMKKDAMKMKKDGGDAMGNGG
jgi:pentapeptide MXKDX repeat protein